MKKNSTRGQGEWRPGEEDEKERRGEERKRGEEK